MKEGRKEAEKREAGEEEEEEEERAEGRAALEIKKEEQTWPWPTQVLSPFCCYWNLREINRSMN